MLITSRKSLVPLMLLILSILAATSARADDHGMDLYQGYRYLYDLDFDSAHRVFDDWKKSHPEDPLGPVSNAAAYLFSEFDRLGILELELFTDDHRFESMKKPSPDPEARAAFERELFRANVLIERILKQRSQDPDALFASVLANGLSGDYAALIEKRNMDGLKLIKRGRKTAEELVQISPKYYDAYLAIGVENYLLSLKPAPVRWFLKLGGAQTDRDEGITCLKLVADKGHYLAPYARLLLAVAALRDDDRQTAKELLAGLSSEFPQNHLYKRELSRLSVD